MKTHMIHLVTQFYTPLYTNVYWALFSSVNHNFSWLIMLLVLFLCLITFFWVFFLLKMSSFLTVTLKSVFIFGQTMRAPIFTSELRWQKVISCPSSAVMKGQRPHPSRYDWLLNNSNWVLIGEFKVSIVSLVLQQSEIVISMFKGTEIFSCSIW